METLTFDFPPPNQGVAARWWAVSAPATLKY